MNEQLKSLKLDMDEEIRQPRFYKRERSSAELFGIIFLAVVLGILAADGARLVIINAWANYQLERISQSMRAESARAEQRLNATREAQAAQARQRAYDEKFNSPECKFWRDMNAQNPGQKTRKGIAQHCP